MARPVGMSALGIAGSLAGTAVKSAVNRSINQYQERRLDQQSKVDWCVRAIPGPAVGGGARNARSARAHDDHSRRHERFPATRSRRRERETEHAPPPRGQPPARRFSTNACSASYSDVFAHRVSRGGFSPPLARRVGTYTLTPSLVPVSPTHSCALASRTFPTSRREDYNYPPYLNVLHYNVDDIENASARAAVRTAHVAYVYALGLFLLNFLGTVILAGGGAVDGVNVVYALFNVVIYGIVGMYAFYCGYKGMATRNGRLTDYYVWLQSFFVLFQLIASSVNGANYYGWSNAGRAKRSEKMSDFFLGWTFFESTMWTLGYLLGAVALYRVVTTRKDAMRSQGSSGYGLRV